MDDIIKIEPNELRTEMQKLRAEGYDFMRSLTGMDWGEDGLGVVYHLEKTTTGENKVIKTATTNREKAEWLPRQPFSGTSRYAPLVPARGLGGLSAPQRL